MRQLETTDAGGGGIQRQGVKDKAEDPLRYPARCRSLVLLLSDPGQALSKQSMLLVGWSVVIPPATNRTPRFPGNSVGDVQHVAEWEAPEAGRGTENLVVTPAEDFQGIRSRICDGEMMQSTECGFGGNYCKLFQVSHNHHVSIADTNIPDEHIEALKKEGGVGGAGFWYCHEMPQR